MKRKRNKTWKTDRLDFECIEGCATLTYARTHTHFFLLKALISKCNVFLFLEFVCLFVYMHVNACYLFNLYKHHRYVAHCVTPDRRWASNMTMSLPGVYFMLWHSAPMIFIQHYQWAPCSLCLRWQLTKESIWPTAVIPGLGQNWSRVLGRAKSVFTVRWHPGWPVEHGWSGNTLNLG